MVYTVEIDDRNQAAQALLEQIRAVARQNKAVKMLVSTEQNQKPFIRKGKRRQGERIKDIGQVWANDERTLESIREKAWPRRNE